MSDETTTTSTETAPLSAEGREYRAGLTQLMLANLEDSGYTYNPKEITEYADPTKAKTLEKDLANFQQQMTELEKKRMTMASGGSAANDYKRIELDRQINNLQGRINKTQNDYDKLEKFTYTDYQIQKAPDPRVQDLINKFGENSKEVKNMQDKIFQEKVDKTASLSGIEKTTLENITKFVNGDLTYTDKQKKQIDTLYSGVRDAVNTLKEDLFKQYGETDAKLRDGVSAVAKAIDKTGFAVEDALNAAQLQVEKSGQNMFSILEDVNKSTEAKFKFQQDLLFQQVDKQVDQQNAMLGLPPNSEASIYQKAKMKQDVLTGLQLQLHEQELQGKLNIQAGVEDSKQKISLSKVALASAQGEKKEGVARDLLGLTAQTMQKKEGTLAAVGESLLGIEQQKAQELKNLAYGNIPSMVAAGQGAKTFEMGATAAAQGINQQAMSPFASMLQTEQQRTFAEATTTTEKSGSFMDAFTGLLGTGAAAAGAFNAMKASAPPSNAASFNNSIPETPDFTPRFLK